MHGTNATRTRAITITSTDVQGSPAVVLTGLGSDAVSISGGMWARRQATNRSVSLRAAAEHLEASGNLDNFRLAAGWIDGDYQFPHDERLPFLDSDVYKWLEAIGWESARGADPELEKLADTAIGVISAAQEPGGYLNTYYQVLKRPEDRWTNLAYDHELYCAGHLIQAAVAHHRGRGDNALLETARRVADDIWREFGPDGRQGVGGHPEIEMALVELARCTGDDRYLDLASFFVDTRGHGHGGHHHFGATYLQDHQPIRQQTTVTGHAVRALYLTAGATDVYLDTGDPDLLTALRTQWEALVSSKMYLTGGVGSRHQAESIGDPYELPPDRAYSETCAAIASIMWSWRLLLATGESRYADLIERTLYNAFAPGFSLDGQRYFYINRLQARVDPDLPPPRTTPRDSLDRQPWFGCACCPPNVMRLLSSLEHYLATRSERGLRLEQYATATLQAQDPNGRLLELRTETSYPHEGKVHITVAQSSDASWELALRIPAWCHDARVYIDGVLVAAAPDPGYLRLERVWAPGTEVVLELDLTPRITRPHPHIDAVRGCVAIERGPLVYGIEERDLPDGIRLADVSLVASGTLDTAAPWGELDDVVPIIAEGRTGHHAPPNRREEPVRLTALPHYVWANRGGGAMRVWIPEA